MNIPQHMDDSQKIVLRNEKNKKFNDPKRQQRDDNKKLDKIEKHGLSMFSEKLSATIGPSYVSAFFLGGTMGAFKATPMRSRRTTKLRISSKVNNIGKISASFGNNVGGGVLMYLMVGKTVNFMFLEELEDLSIPAQNAIFGGMTGALYKSTRGTRPMMLASGLGSVVGSVFGYYWSKGYFRF